MRYCIWHTFIIKIMHRYREALINLIRQLVICTSRIRRGALSIGFTSQAQNNPFCMTGKTTGITCVDVDTTNWIPTKSILLTVPNIKGSIYKCNIDGLTSKRNPFAIRMKLWKSRVYCKYTKLKMTKPIMKVFKNISTKIQIQITGKIIKIWLW